MVNFLLKSGASVNAKTKVFLILFMFYINMKTVLSLILYNHENYTKDSNVGIL